MVKMECIFRPQDGCFDCVKYGLSECPEGTVKPEFVKEDGKYYQIKNREKIERMGSISGFNVLLSKDMTCEEQIYFMCWKQKVDGE